MQAAAIQAQASMMALVAGCGHSLCALGGCPNWRSAVARATSARFCVAGTIAGSVLQSLCFDIGVHRIRHLVRRCTVP
jgi:hypothetical protein